LKKNWNFVYDFFQFFNFKIFLMTWPVTSTPRGQNHVIS